MKIHLASETDIKELVQVEIESKLQSIPELTAPYEVDAPSRIHRWQSYFKGESPNTSRPERITLKAVNSDNKIIGYLSGHLSTRFGLDAEIQSFYVLKQEQRKRVGTQLLAAFVEWLHKHDASSVCVGFHPENTYKAFYLKHGGMYLNEHWIFWQNISASLEKNT